MTEKTREELIIRGSNLPICPACGNGNAMLEKWERDCAEYGGQFTIYYCRDCDHEVRDDNAVLVYTQLDEVGRGSASTYTETTRCNAEELRIDNPTKGEETMTKKTDNPVDNRRNAIIAVLDAAKGSPCAPKDIVKGLLIEHRASLTTIRRDLKALIADKMVGVVGGRYYTEVKTTKPAPKKKRTKKTPPTEVDLSVVVNTALDEKDKPYKTALIDGKAPFQIKGCPMGRGKDAASAIRDLINRAEMESKVTINIISKREVPEVTDEKRKAELVEYFVNTYQILPIEADKYAGEVVSGRLTLKQLEKDLNKRKPSTGKRKASKRSTPAKPAAKKPAAKKKATDDRPKGMGMKKYSRVEALAAVLRENTGKTLTTDQLVQMSDDKYAANGGKPNPKEARWYAGFASKLLTALELAEKPDSKSLKVKL